MATAAAVKDEEKAHRFAKDHLKAFVERVERLEEEKKALSDDIRDVYAEAKANGFDVKALRQVVRLRKQDVEERKEQEAVVAAEQIMAKAREATVIEHERTMMELKRELGRLVVNTTAKVTGKVLTPEDQRRLQEEASRQITS